MTAVEAEVHTIGVPARCPGCRPGPEVAAVDFRGRDRRLLLEVRTDNTAAIALYASEGFTTPGGGAAT